MSKPLALPFSTRRAPPFFTGVCSLIKPFMTVCRWQFGILNSVPLAPSFYDSRRVNSAPLIHPPPSPPLPCVPDPPPRATTLPRLRRPSSYLREPRIPTRPMRQSCSGPPSWFVGHSARTASSGSPSLLNIFPTRCPRGICRAVAPSPPRPQ